jgi:hypothetical protein
LSSLGRCWPCLWIQGLTRRSNNRVITE